MSGAGSMSEAEVRKAYAELNNALCWATTCLNCASLLDQCYEYYCEVEQFKPVLTAWIDPGPRPAVHEEAKNWLRANWPTLANALDAAALAEPTGQEGDQ